MKVIHHYPADESTPERVKVLETDPALAAAENARFAAYVQAAVDELPERFLRALDTCSVNISDDGAKHGAYGIYLGPTIARSDFSAQIFVYRDTLLRDFGHDPVRLAHEVRRVVRHELGHHLGFDEPGVEALGL